MASLLMLYAAITGAAGYYIGRAKNRTAAGVVFGLVLGVIGLLLVALLPAVDDRQTRRDDYYKPLPAGGTPVDDMARLKALYDRSRISEAEYVAAAARIDNRT